MSYERPSIEKATHDCWAMQDASNLAGVTRHVHLSVNVAREDAWQAGIDGDRANLHPVIVCGINKMLQLSMMGEQFGEGVDHAYAWLCRWQDRPTGTDAYREDLKATIDSIWRAFHPEVPTHGQA